VAGGSEYYWTTRGDRKLQYSAGGTYATFYSSAGYIKIEDGSAILKNAAALGLIDTLTQINPQFAYIEHMSQNLSTITYLGSAEEFAP
jgi:hypothetical protein